MMITGELVFLRTYVFFLDSSNDDGLLHGVAAERLAQFLVQDDFDEGGLLVLHLVFHRLGQGLAQSFKNFHLQVADRKSVV